MYFSHRNPDNVETRDFLQKALSFMEIFGRLWYNAFIEKGVGLCRRLPLN